MDPTDHLGLFYILVNTYNQNHGPLIVLTTEMVPLPTEKRDQFHIVVLMLEKTGARAEGHTRLRDKRMSPREFFRRREQMN